MLQGVDDPTDPRRLLFVTPTGHPVAHDNFYARVYRKTVAARWDADHPLHTPRFHNLRHAVATGLLDDGGTEVDVMKRLGHSQLATTVDLYGRHRQAAADNVVPLRPAEEA